SRSISLHNSSSRWGGSRELDRRQRGEIFGSAGWATRAVSVLHGGKFAIAPFPRRYGGPPTNKRLYWAIAMFIAVRG
ncbi:MAG: hypothetical protein ACJ8EA_08745, partial [Xanthobacteraceae bacterium]